METEDEYKTSFEELEIKQIRTGLTEHHEIDIDSNPEYAIQYKEMLVAEELNSIFRPYTRHTINFSIVNDVGNSKKIFLAIQLDPALFIRNADVVDHAAYVCNEDIDCFIFETNKDPNSIYDSVDINHPLYKIAEIAKKHGYKWDDQEGWEQHISITVLLAGDNPRFDMYGNLNIFTTSIDLKESLPKKSRKKT
jgi:hypothetical protein